MLLETKNATKYFNGVHALEHVSLKVDKDQIVSVIGPNGAGKTTLFNVLSGVYRHDDGQTVFDGVDITNKEQFLISRLGMGRTFQNIRLFPGLSVIENLNTSRDSTAGYGIFQALLHTPKQKRIDKENLNECMRYLEMVGLAEYRDEYPQNLPYGMQKRVELARALSLDPKLILLDEPAAGLNPREVDDFIQLIVRIKEDLHLGILIIDHRMRVVNELSDYVYVLNFGKLLFEGTPEECKTNPEVIKAYIGEGKQIL